MKVKYGELVVCVDPAREWFGWAGTVLTMNAKNLGISFSYTREVPPPTGRWLPKTACHRLDDLDNTAAIVQEAHGRYISWTTLLEKARDSSVLAVETYNRPSARFRTGAFVTLMIIAWTSLLLAIRTRGGLCPYEVEADGTVVVIDGRKRHLGIWPLARSYFSGADRVVFKNLELFVKARNEIEHADSAVVDRSLLGECQALLRNFEDILVAEFGSRFSVNPGLVVPVTFSYADPETRQEALGPLVDGQISRLLSLVASFRADLDEDVFLDQRYSFRVFLMPRVGNRARNANLAVQWINVDTANADELSRVDNAVNALLKVRTVEVVHQDKLSAKAVAEEVSTTLGRKFSHSYHHPRACRALGAWKSAKRPRRADDCNGSFAVYDSTHKDVVYTRAWVRRLLNKLSTAEGQVEVFGKELGPA